MTEVAISHDWLLNTRGAERVLGQFCVFLKNPEVYTLFYDKEAAPSCTRNLSVHVSALNRLPGVSSYYRLLLPAFHWAISQFEVTDAEVLLSISHSVAKAIPHPEDMPHICYCLTPMRYLWEPRLYGQALGGSLRGKAFRLASDSIKRQDLASNAGVDSFVAISKTIKDRIWRVYRREAEVIYPCVDLGLYTPADVNREDFYLVVSALVAQKNIELAIEAFNQNGRRLLVVGSGPMSGRLSRLAGPNIHLMGWRPDGEVADLYRRARALIFPGVEDFGLVPLEAQACGCPVIALNEGGLTETVIANETGWFFSDPCPEALNRAIQDFEREKLDPLKAISNAQRFSPQRFQNDWRALFVKLGLEATW